MTFNGASLVGQTAKPQGRQADGGSNLLQVRSQRAGCSWWGVGRGNCLSEDEKQDGSKLDEPRVRRILSGRLELGVGG